MSRPLPASPEAEDALLSSYLIAPKDVGALCAEHGIAPGDFHLPANGIVFAHLSEMWGEALPIDIITLTQRLADRGQLSAAGDAHRVSHLLTYMPTAANAEYYLQAVREKSTLRRIIRLCTEHEGRAYEATGDAQECLSDLSADLTAIAAGTGRRGAPTLKQSLLEKMNRMECDEVDADLLRTRLAALDRESPLRRGDMPLISGERKAGKSILALSIAANMAMNDDAVLYFSLEDRTPKVIDRLVAGAAKVPIVKHHHSRMSEGDMDRMHVSVQRLCESRLQIRDDVFDLPAIVAVSRQQKIKWGDLALIVVDYAQLVRAKMRDQDSREREVATVSRTLRLLAMELNAAVLLLVQLNKQGDTRESKALEQDATAMWEVRKTEKEDEENTHRLIVIPWQRNGESGVAFRALFQGHFARVENLAER